MKTKEKVVLAFSGGLDTSYCVKYLSIEQKLEVHSVLVNTGGFSSLDLVEINQKAMDLGVAQHTIVDATQDFYEKVLKYLIFGNVLKNSTYPLSVGAERVCQALAIADHAKKIGAKYIAHGSTGAGNDQVRFDLIFNILVPEIEVLTPIRDQQLSRSAEVNYLKDHGVNVPWNKAKYSVNKGIWGTSVGGEETLTSDLALPEEAYPSPLKKEFSKIISLSFEAGELISLDDEQLPPIKAIVALNSLAGDYAIGRDIHVGDTIIGIKGRVGFEAPAPLIIIKAHHALEKHVLTKWQLHWKDQMANWYGLMIHEGQFLEPSMRNIESFLQSTQHRVTGTVQIKLAPYRFEVIGIKSVYDLMNSAFGSYGEMNKGWSGEDVKGFTRIMANQTKMYYQVNELT